MPERPMTTDDSRPAGLTLDIVATIDDHLAFNRHLLRLPANARLRRRREIVMVALAPLALLVGIVFAWAVDPHRSSLGTTLRDMIADDPLLIARYVLAAFAVMALFMLLARLATRRQLRALVRYHLRTRPGVDPADPDLAYVTTARFDADGISSDSIPGTSFVRWPTVTRIDENADAIYLMTGSLSGLFVPRRCLDPGQDARLRAILAAYGPA